ncbi:hypothetical protein PMAC_002820 [Pneumocystis sp. 'macacae']|nr:hypothetical protein PMAC_002820 [Pneumocystis sp. 'macacae']
MPRVGVLVMGPAGSGKTTFSEALVGHMQQMGRAAHLVNLDPAAEGRETEATIGMHRTRLEHSRPEASWAV